MPGRTYGLLEAHILHTFLANPFFSFQGKRCQVLEADKPRPHRTGGECKTDVYVRAVTLDTGEEFALKISVKNLNREFMGNKLKKADAQAYLGMDWEDILIRATTSIKDQFESKVLLYATRHYPTQANSVTVGWKLEVADRPRALSVPIPLTDQQVRDYIYKGTNMPQNKKDSFVNGRIVPDSGIAEYLLITSMEQIQTSDDVIRQMQRIDEAELGDTYFIFTANNYRTDVQRADGARALAVRIEWKADHGKMVPIFHYDQPLHYTGQNDMAPLVRQAMQTLGKRNVSQLVPGVDVDSHLFLP